MTTLTDDGIWEIFPRPRFEWYRGVFKIQTSIHAVIWRKDDCLTVAISEFSNACSRRLAEGQGFVGS